MSREAEVLKLLYPKSIPAEEYEHAIHLIRLAVSVGSTKGTRVVRSAQAERRIHVPEKKSGRAGPQPGSNTSRALEWLEKQPSPATSKQIAKGTGLTDRQVWGATYQLRLMKRIEAVGRNQWKVKR